MNKMIIIELIGWRCFEIMVMLLLFIVIKFNEVMKSASEKKQNKTQNHLERKWTDEGWSACTFHCMKTAILWHIDKIDVRSCNITNAYTLHLAWNKLRTWFNMVHMKMEEKNQEMSRYRVIKFTYANGGKKDQN